MRYSLTFSLIIHSLLLFYLSQQSGGPPKTEGNDPVTMKIVPKTPEDVPDLASTQTDGPSMPKPSPNTEDKQCGDFYYGVGVYTELGGTRISRVMPGYPAARAGLKDGDYIVEGYQTLRGEEGKKTTIRVFRGELMTGKTLTFTMVREKICERRDP